MSACMLHITMIDNMWLAPVEYAPVIIHTLLLVPAAADKGDHQSWIYSKFSTLHESGNVTEPIIVEYCMLLFEYICICIIDVCHQAALDASAVT